PLTRALVGLFRLRERVSQKVVPEQPAAVPVSELAALFEQALVLLRIAHAHGDARLGCFDTGIAQVAATGSNQQFGAAQGMFRASPSETTTLTVNPELARFAARRHISRKALLPK